MQLSWNQVNPVVNYANRLQCSPGQVIGPRVIKDNQLIYIGSGKGVCRIGGREYSAEPGDLFYYGPGITNHYIADDREPYLLYGIHFSWNADLRHMLHDLGIVDVSAAAAEQLQDNRMILGERGMDELKLEDRMQTGNSQELPNLFQAIANQYQLASETSPLLCKGLFIQLLYQLHRLTRLERLSLSPYAKSVLHIRDKLDEQAAKPYDRSWLFEWSGYNADYVSRLFRQHFGVSPHEYHHLRKIDKAKSLLQHTDLTASAIAERLSFASAPYFNRVFHERTGMTPIAYRRQIRSV